MIQIDGILKLVMNQVNTFIILVVTKCLLNCYRDFVNKELGLNIIIENIPAEDPMGDLSLAILPGFSSEADVETWRNTTKGFL